jgi:uncharacterized delta-60 repeat protein
MKGEIFADLVQGKVPLFKGDWGDHPAFTEDDTNRINIDENWITVEQAQGDLDLSFGGGTGVAVSPYTSNRIGGVVVQPDGKILVTARIDRAFGVIRFNSDGTLDLTFGGGDGLVSLGTGFPYSIALQTDGKILIAGEDNQFATLIRLNNDGTLDTSFDGDGIIAYDDSVSMASFFDQVTIAPNGKIVLAGTLVDLSIIPGIPPQPPFGRIVRYNLDGSVDASFSERDSYGTVFRDLDLVIQPDGKIIASTDLGGSSRLNRGDLFRFNLDGSFDLSWSDGISDVIEVDELTGINRIDTDVIALQPDGKILVTGTIRDSGDISLPLIFRINSDATLDTSFGDDGVSLPEFAFNADLKGRDSLKGITIQANGKFLVTAILDDDSIGLVRFDSDGSIDLTFGNSGSITTPVTNDEDENLVLQPNGQILVAGTNNNGFVSVVRYIGFESDQYGASYPDLITGIGYNLEALTQHYYNAGVFEGRVTDNFGEFRYIASNPDLITALGANGPGATQHYITYGFGEGRFITAFDAARYLNSHEDLRRAFVFDLEAASLHYITSGLAEGRDPNRFESDRYIASYSDLIQGFGYNLEAGSNHYLRNGRFEDRQVLFNPQAYIDRYSDLQAAFSNNLTAATAHYITNGFAEGRTWM